MQRTANTFGHLAEPPYTAGCVCPDHGPRPREMHDIEKAMKWLCPGFGQRPTHYGPYRLAPGELCGSCAMDQNRITK